MRSRRAQTEVWCVDLRNDFIPLCFWECMVKILFPLLFRDEMAVGESEWIKPYRWEIDPLLLILTSRMLSMSDLGGMCVFHTKWRAWKYLKRCECGRLYFWESCEKDPNTSSIYRSLIVLSSFLNQPPNPSYIKDGGNRGFLTKGERIEAGCIPKCPHTEIASRFLLLFYPNICNLAKGKRVKN